MKVGCLELGKSSGSLIQTDANAKGLRQCTSYIRTGALVNGRPRSQPTSSHLRGDDLRTWRDLTADRLLAV